MALFYPGSVGRNGGKSQAEARFPRMAIRRMLHRLLSYGSDDADTLARRIARPSRGHSENGWAGRAGARAGKGQTGSAIDLVRKVMAKSVR